jgi:hypothetical protein
VKNILKLLVFAVAVFALPALAGSPPNGSKFFTLTMSASGNVVTATLMNTSPPNTSGATTSSIGSVDLSVDLGWLFDPNSITVQGKPYKTKPSQQPAGHIKVVSPSPIKPGTNLVISFAVTNSSGDGTFKALVYTGSSFNGNQFAPDPTVPQQNIASVPTGTLPCNGGGNDSTPGAGSVIAMRGKFNKDGTSNGGPCVGVPIYVSNTLGNNVGLPPTVVHFRWDHSGDAPPPAPPHTPDTFATAAFAYDIFYANAPATAYVGWRRLQGQLAVDPGANPNANSANPVAFIVVPVCDSNNNANQVPLPYGSGTLADDSTRTLYFNSTGSELPPPPVAAEDYDVDFPIYVGLERMQVKSINADGTWTVDRGQLGTTAVAHLSVGDVDPLVMSTPLPSVGATDPTVYTLDANGDPQQVTFNPPLTTTPYPANTQAQMCLVQPLPPTTPPSITIIDIGDGWVPVR